MKATLVLLLLPAAFACSGSAPAPATAASTALPPFIDPNAAVLESSTALMPRAVTSFGAAELGGSVYAFGGYSGTPHAYTRAGQSGELWRLDPASRAFELALVSEPTQGPALVGAHGRLIRVGGMRAGAVESERMVSIAEVAAYTPGASVWSPLPPLPAPRSSHAATVVGDTLFVVGGWELAGRADSGRFHRTMIAIDLRNDSSRSLPQPFALRAIAAAPLDGRLVVLGGIDENTRFSRAVHVYDPASGNWSRAADLPREGFGAAATSTGDTLYASTLDGVLHALDAVDGTWRPVRRLAFPRFFHQLVALDAERVLALGGISGMHGGPRVRHVETAFVKQSGPTVLSFVVTNPLAARNRQGVFVLDDSLYVFGGNRSLGQHDFAPEDFVREGARLDLASLVWTPIASFPVGRQTMQTLATEEGGFVLGGFGHDGREARATAEAYRYDAEHDQWHLDASRLPSPRTQFGLAEHGGKRWVFGGLDFKPEAQGESQFDHPTSVLVAAPGEAFRASGSELSTPRRAFGGALLDGRYYMVGGMAGGFSPVERCEVFDFASSTFRDIRCPSSTRISPQLVALDGKLYLAGGSSAGQGGLLTPNASLEVYDPKEDRWWTAIERLPVEPKHLTMLPFDGSLLLYSAHDQEGRVRVTLVTP